METDVGDLGNAPVESWTATVATVKLKVDDVLKDLTPLQESQAHKVGKVLRHLSQATARLAGFESARALDWRRVPVEPRPTKAPQPEPQPHSWRWQDGHWICRHCYRYKRVWRAAVDHVPCCQVSASLARIGAQRLHQLSVSRYLQTPERHVLFCTLCGYWCERAA